MAALKDHTEHEDEKVKNMDDRALTTMMAEERAEQFRAMLGQMIGQAIEENNEKLSQDISRMVNDKVIKEVDYLMRVADERDEERFRQLDETIRLYPVSYTHLHHIKADAPACKKWKRQSFFQLFGKEA